MLLISITLARFSDPVQHKPWVTVCGTVKDAEKTSAEKTSQGV
jgi:hypothetical protein